jgi:hypothetical protein
MVTETHRSWRRGRVRSDHEIRLDRGGHRRWRRGSGTRYCRRAYSRTIAPVTIPRLDCADCQPGWRARSQPGPAPGERVTGAGRARRLCPTTPSARVVHCSASRRHCGRAAGWEDEQARAGTRLVSASVLQMWTSGCELGGPQFVEEEHSSSFSGVLAVQRRCSLAMTSGGVACSVVCAERGSRSTVRAPRGRPWLARVRYGQKPSCFSSGGSSSRVEKISSSASRSVSL